MKITLDPIKLQQVHKDTIATLELLKVSSHGAKKDILQSIIDYHKKELTC